MNSVEAKVIKVEENDAKKSFGYRLNDSVKFLFGLLNRSCRKFPFLITSTIANMRLIFKSEFVFVSCTGR